MAVFHPGVTHNIPLLREVYNHQRFRAGRLSTKFLAEEFPEGFQGTKLDQEETDQLVATAAEVYRRLIDRQIAWEQASTRTRDTNCFRRHNDDGHRLTAYCH